MRKVEPKVGDLSFDEESHKYLLGRGAVPSVTQVIGEILGQQWYAADWYLQRGRAVHACAAYIAQGVEFEHDPQIQGQVQALRSFFAVVAPEVVLVEKPMASATYRYAGTPDLVARLDRRLALFDFKAHVDQGRATLQLGGYAQLYRECYPGREVVTGYAVEIREDGNFSITKAINLRQARGEFLALRTVYGIRERMKLTGRGAAL